MHIQDRSDVVVTDIQVPFGSMVVFMMKWALASIPALIIILLLMRIFAGAVEGVVGVVW